MLRLNTLTRSGIIRDRHVFFMKVLRYNNWLFVLMLFFGAFTPITTFTAPNSVVRSQDPSPLTAKAHELTAKALDSVALRGDYDSAIRFYEAALEEMPDDQGILIALSRTKYESEKQSGLIKPQPDSKAAILLDALQFGRGDWHESIRYLEDAMRDEQDADRLMATRDALVEIEGIWDVQKIGSLRYFDGQHANAELLNIAFQQMNDGYFDDAISSLSGALKLNPRDIRIREAIAYVSGLQYNRYENLLSWAENQKSLNGKFRVNAILREKEALHALAQSQKALKLSREYEDSEAISISKRAIDMAQQAIAMARTMLTWADARISAVKNLQSSSGGSFGAASRVKGDVRIRHNKSWTTFNTSTPILPGDHLQTGEESAAELILTDGSTVSLDANSSIEIASRHRSSSIYSRIRGTIRAQINCVRRFGIPCRRLCYRINLNLACVRGTELEITTEKGGAVKITVLNGRIEVVNEINGNTSEISLGQRITISTSGEVESVSSVDTSTIERWWEQP